MTKTHLHLLLLGGSGQALRRWHGTRGGLATLLLLLCAGLALSGLVALQGAQLRAEARAGSALQAVNLRLLGSLAHAERQLPTLRVAQAQAQRGALRLRRQLCGALGAAAQAADADLLELAGWTQPTLRPDPSNDRRRREQEAVAAPPGEGDGACPVDPLPSHIEHAVRLDEAFFDAGEHLQDTRQRLAATPAIRPVRQAWLSSTFGRRRDPLGGHWVFHKGLDLAGQVGTPIYAPADGLVIWAAERGGYGKTVVLDHGHALQTHFAHLSAIFVEAGARVARGSRIAAMGNTGRSTGAHLHYEVRRLGEPLNPRHFMLD